jgi:Tfp pilus assembly protein PilV
MKVQKVAIAKSMYNPIKFSRTLLHRCSRKPQVTQAGERAGEAGFTVVEVAVASIVTMVGLVFLANMFTLAITQNRLVKQYTTATTLAQQKLEELNTVQLSTDSDVAVGGGLTDGTKQTGYWETLYVDPSTGVVSTTIPAGATPIFFRYWQVEADSSLNTSQNKTVILSVRVVAKNPTSGRTAEEVTLTTGRAW